MPRSTGGALLPVRHLSALATQSNSPRVATLRATRLRATTSTRCRSSPRHQRLCRKSVRVKFGDRSPLHNFPAHWSTPRRDTLARQIRALPMGEPRISEGVAACVNGIVSLRQVNAHILNTIQWRLASTHGPTHSQLVDTRALMQGSSIARLWLLTVVTGVALLALVPATAVAAGSATFSGHVALPARGSPPSPSWSIPLTVTFLQPGTSTLVASATSTTDTSGNFSFSNLQPG